MSSGPLKAGPAARSGQSGFSGIAPSNQSLLLDKLNVRRSTPDSEALASSDDEVENHRQEHSQPIVQPHKPVRRSSWLNDTSQAIRPRQGSFASSTISPTASHPTTPSADTGVASWGAHPGASATLGRAHQGSTAFPWGTAIWNNERKEPPSRLAEVLPSPTSNGPGVPGNSGVFGAEGSMSQMSQTSPGPRDQSSNSQIPFAIPLHPTPKTYRSQSYSVGQLDPDTSSAAMGPPAMHAGRARPTGPMGLQHRPSRPSMLSEMSNEGGMLGKVKEVEDDDDDDSTKGSSQGVSHQNQTSVDARTMEMLARENAILRQQQQQFNRIRPRASTSYVLGNGYSVRDPVPEESDYAIDELDESGDGQEVKRALGRRLSEFGAGPFRSSYTLENRQLEKAKKAYWQSSLDFGGLGDIPQSRRHSFADVPVPTRQGSISSISDARTVQESNLRDQPQDLSGSFLENSAFNSTSPASYFQGGPSLANAQQGLPGSAYGANPYASPYGLPPSFPNRVPSPHRNMYGLTQPRHNQLLHIVLFKCSRADVFYIQEGTGLTVKPGDLVIVEADRGTDLGTVAKDNVDWQTAKDLKEHYSEEHYKWLMMYSQNAAAAQEGAAAGLMAASNGMQGGAIGGMGPPNQHHVQEPGAGELKPKLIKRLAQSHEIQNLRDKEGNEAKAKRVCMQKVKEHGLNMEILDAEFQMDWKKLTFYYFADAYINFNSLVTDLFKIYKTRIWMSAINPASFASPTLGLQAPSGIGPGAVGLGRGSNNTSERRQNNQQEQQPPSNFGGPNSSNRSYQSPYSQQAMVPNTAFPPSSYPYGAYGAFGNTARTGNVPYMPGMMQPMDPYGNGFPSGGDYQAARNRFPSPHGAAAPHDQGLPSMAGHNDWVSNFQGLSLNSR